MTTRRVLLTSILSLAVTGPAMAQGPAATYPDKPVRIIAGSSAGGTADLVARILAENLSKKLNGRFVVENVPGNSGGIASVQVARAAPDGYTLMLAAINSHAILPALNKTLQYDPIKDFAPVSLISTSPNLLMVNPKVGAKTIPELIAAMKKEPGKFNYGTGGIGTSQHLAMEIFMQATGTKATHIPYAGSGQLLNALIGGTVDVAFDTMTTGIGHVRQNNLVGLGVSSKARNTAAPDMPAVSEFVPGFDVVAWNAIIAPANTPAPIVDKLSKAIAEIMRMPEVAERFQKMGTTPVGSTPDELRAFMASDIKKFDDIVKAANIKAE